MANVDDVTGVIAVTSSDPGPAVLRLEPWGDEREMRAGETVSLRFRGPAPVRLEVEVRQGEIVVYGWPGSVVSPDDEAEPR